MRTEGQGRAFVSLPLCVCLELGEMNMPIEPRLDVVTWAQVPALGDSTSAKEQTHSFQAGPWKELREVMGTRKES